MSRELASARAALARAEGLRDAVARGERPPEDARRAQLNAARFRTRIARLEGRMPPRR